MKIDFNNKTVLITGGSRGIGAEVAKHFNDRNANVIVTCTNTKNIDSLDNKRVKNNINYLSLDLSSQESIKSFLDIINKEYSIDILINNAGVNKIDEITSLRKKDWDWINNVNLRGPYLLTKALAKKMIVKKSGHIINIASIFGVVSKAKRAAYSASKWGLIGLTKAVALDLAKYNIMVNAVSPGFVNTELTKKILSDTEIKELTEIIPIKRFASPEEIAKVILFLSSDYNKYLSGQNIIIDGGYTCV
jgi:3-oxoacyl-[acyl-carrier protein] reductase